MKNINWLQVAGVVTVVAMVLLSLFMLTGFLRKLPVFNSGAFINLILMLGGTIAAVFYVSKTNYGVAETKGDKTNE